MFRNFDERFFSLSDFFLGSVSSFDFGLVKKWIKRTAVKAISRTVFEEILWTRTFLSGVNTPFFWSVFTFCLINSYLCYSPGTSTLSLHGQGCSVWFRGKEKSEVSFSLFDPVNHRWLVACIGCHTCCLLFVQHGCWTKNRGGFTPPNHPILIGFFHDFHHPFWELGSPYFWKYPHGPNFIFPKSELRHMRGTDTHQIIRWSTSEWAALKTFIRRVENSRYFHIIGDGPSSSQFRRGL